MVNEYIDNIKLIQGDYLLREGEDSTTLYYVVSGVLAVHKRQGDKTSQVGTVYAGEIVGEMSFLTGSPRFATVKATGPCELLALKTNNLDKVKNQLPIWLNTLVATMVDRLSRNNTRIRI